MLQAKRVSQITLLQSGLLSAIPGVIHAFSTRRAEHNSFTVGPTTSENPAVQLNRARLLAAAGMAGWPVLKLRQTHSGIVHDMKDTWAANEPLQGDGAITALRGAALGVETADCTPILLAALDGSAVSAIHAGWRGIAQRIAANAVVRLAEVHGIQPSNLAAVIGPHNAVCCYEVGEEVVDAIQDSEAIVRKPQWKKPHLDQGRANRNQLLEAGIPASQIVSSGLCTQCRPDLFYSYRREGAATGRMLALIGLTP